MNLTVYCSSYTKFLRPVSYVSASNLLVTKCLVIQVNYEVRNILTGLILVTCVDDNLVILCSFYVLCTGLAGDWGGAPQSPANP